MGHGEITTREILFSIIVVLLVIALGVALVSTIQNKIEEENEVYYKAMKIDNDAEIFNYAKSTNAGNSLVYGVVSSVDTVSLPEISNSFLYLERVKEEYTRHTRTVTTTDSNGNTTTKTEVYYSWDRVASNSLISEEIEIFENIYSTSLFNFNNFVQRYSISNSEFNPVNGLDKVRGNYIYDGSEIRYYYNYIPTQITANFLLNFDNNTIKPVLKNTISFYSGTIEDRIESLEQSVKSVGVIIWVFLSIITIIGVLIFVNGYHHWLEKG